MKQPFFLSFFAFIAAFLCGKSQAETISNTTTKAIPQELLTDPTLASEYGVNTFTAPSINELFTQLDVLGEIQYEELKFPSPIELSPKRRQIALSLGIFIADGFAAIQANQLGDIEVIGRNILAHAEALGTGERVQRHSRNIIQAATEGARDQLRESLAQTQQDVEAEMVELRDVDIAHLISLGGWLRGFQYACHSIRQSFHSSQMRLLARRDVLVYFQTELHYLNQRLEETKFTEIYNGLRELERLLDRPRTRDFSLQDLDRISTLADTLIHTLQE